MSNDVGLRDRWRIVSRIDKFVVLWLAIMVGGVAGWLASPLGSPWRSGLAGAAAFSVAHAALVSLSNDWINNRVPPHRRGKR